MVRSAHTGSSARPIYAFSVIRGGAYNRDELVQALAEDPVAARHYAGFDVAHTRMVAAKAQAVYVSYRRGNAIYWTGRPVRLAAGEALLTDGANLARARCGNRISSQRMLPAEFREPPQVAAEGETALDAESPEVASGSREAPLVTEIFPPGMVPMPALGGTAPSRGYLWFPPGGGFLSPMLFPTNGLATGTLPAAPPEPGPAVPTDPIVPQTVLWADPWQTTTTPPFPGEFALDGQPPAGGNVPMPPLLLPIAAPSGQGFGTISVGIESTFTFGWPEEPNTPPFDPSVPPQIFTSSGGSPEFSNPPKQPQSGAVPEPGLSAALAAMLAAFGLWKVRRRVR
jgi:hypothetical protein